MPRRQVSIFINGKQVKREIGAIASEKNKLVRALKRMTEGSDEYNHTVREINKLNPILNKHRKAVRGVESSYDKISKLAKNAFLITGVTVGAREMASYGKEIFKLGVQMDTLDRKAKTVFGETLPQVTEAAEENAEAAGLTERQYRDQATAMADLLKPMKLTKQESADLSLTTLELAAANSEWTGRQFSTIEVMGSFRKALLGSREELERYGIEIKQSEVNNRLAQKGLKDLEGEFKKQAEAIATLELISEKSADAQRAYTENTDSAVRTVAELTARLTELKERIASALLPVFGRMVRIVNNFVGAITDYFEVPISDKIREEQIELNTLVSKITDANIEQDERNRLINVLDKNYPNFLKNLNKESVTNEELSKRLSVVNEQYILKIALAQEDAKLEKAKEELSEQFGRQARKEEDIRKKLNEANLEYNLGLDLTNKSLKENIENTIQAIREKEDLDKSLGSEADRLINLINNWSNYGTTSKLVIEKQKKNIEELEKVRERVASNVRQGIESAGFDFTGGAETDPDGDKKDREEELRRKAEAAKIAKERKRRADKEAKELERHQQRLSEIVKKFQEEARLDQLSEDERKIAELAIRYDKEIDLAKELEEKGVQEATEKRLELESLREKAIRDLRFELANERYEKELEEEKQRIEKRDAEVAAFEASKLAAENEIRDALRQTLYDEDALELLRINDHYQSLIELAEQYGIDTLDIELAREDALNQARDKQAEKDIARAQRVADAEMALQYAKLEIAQEASDGLKEIAGDNQALAAAIFAFDKVLAAAEVILNLQRETASISATWGAVPAVALPLLTAAKVRAGVRLGTIAATSIAKVTQKKDGGFHYVTGQDDGVTYRAKYIGEQQTGMLPSRPVVLASERGREYFVSNADLNNPYVFDHVQAIENIKHRRVPQFVDGGFSDEVEPNTPPPQGSGGSEQLASAINQLILFFQNGKIFARIDDDTAIEIREKLVTLDDASGGVLNR